LNTVEEYRQWCVSNGFSRKLKKHWKQRSRERFHVEQAAAKERLKQKKREQRNSIQTLADICEGRLKESDVTQPHLQRLCQVVRPQSGPHQGKQVNKKSLLKLLSHLHQCRAKVFDGSPVISAWGDCLGNTYIEALALMAVYAGSWLRSIESWKPRSHSASRQFTSLLRHLFVQYDDMPAFFDSVWFASRTRDCEKRRNWYVHVGKGQNIRTCDLPIPFTKKMAHYFMQSPHDVTVNQAIRMAQVYGLGGDERLARAIFGSRLTESFEYKKFWESVIRWFISHPKEVIDVAVESAQQRLLGLRPSTLLNFLNQAKVFIFCSWVSYAYVPHTFLAPPR